MVLKNMNHIALITVRRVDVITQSEIIVAESLFINYFAELYKDSSASILGLNKPVEQYLREIFNKTERAFHDGKLFLLFAYLENNIVGMSTYELLENNTILIRTLPIDLDYIQQEKDIRTKLIQGIHEKFPSARNVIIMVRKANTVHQDLCVQNGFAQTEQVFDISFIKQQYDTTHYYGYLHNFKGC